MTSKIDIARTIATKSDGSSIDFVLFEHGTVLYLRHQDETRALAAAKELDAFIGPYGGEGGPPGDFIPMKLKAFDGWLVEFCWGSACITIVLPEDLGFQPEMSSTEVFQGVSDPEALRAGLRGRELRNRDMRERKIVAKSWTPRV